MLGVVAPDDAEKLQLDAELNALDAIARFKFDSTYDFPDLSEDIAGLPSLPSDCGIALLKIAGLWTEGITESQALRQILPPLSFPASQERYQRLQEATEHQQYVRLSQVPAPAPPLPPPSTPTLGHEDEDLEEEDEDDSDDDRASDALSTSNLPSPSSAAHSLTPFDFAIGPYEPNPVLSTGPAKDYCGP